MWNIILEVMTPIGFTFAAVFFGLWRIKADESSDLLDLLDRVRDDHKASNEKLKKQNDTDLEFYKKLAHDAMDRANRNGAIAEGLAEDLAALKAYDPEEIEERLKKIREIRAEEEREKRLEKLEKLSREVSAQIALSMLNSGGLGFPASAYCSLANWQRIDWR